MAMLAHLLGILGPIGPLIIWMIKKDQLPFVNDQGKESLNFELTILIGWAALFVVTLVGSFTVIIGCLGSILMLGLFVTNAILCVMGGMKANTGVAYRYPINFRFIK